MFLQISHLALELDLSSRWATEGKLLAVHQWHQELHLVSDMFNHILVNYMMPMLA
jgi:hypothetical protein